MFSKYFWYDDVAIWPFLGRKVVDICTRYSTRGVSLLVCFVIYAG